VVQHETLGLNTWVLTTATKKIDFDLELKNLFFFFDSTKIWTQGRTLYQLSHVPTPFCFALFIFQIRSWIAWPGQPGLQSSYLCFQNIWDHRYAPPCQLLRWSAVSLTICPDGPPTIIFTSWVAGNTGVSHCAQHWRIIFKSSYSTYSSFGVFHVTCF
jgi:hypothetical protein